MALQPVNSGIPHLQGDKTAENITLSPGQLNGFPGGVFAGAGDDTIKGSSDAEIIYGENGNDSILGGAGNDNLLGGKGNDVLFGEVGNDFLEGGKGIDFLDGGDGNDILRGGDGIDLLMGGAGNDTLIGDKGVDVYKGGTGNDLFVLKRDQAGKKLDGNEVPDAIIVDFESTNDVIGLTGGLTYQDILLTPVSLSLNDPLLATITSSTKQKAIDFLAQAGITQQTLDPDGNNKVDGIAIKLKTTNAWLGVVLNVTANDLPATRFTSVNF
jgi:Ca2+-binding RTX toxin-like protein